MFQSEENHEHEDYHFKMDLGMFVSSVVCTCYQKNAHNPHLKC